MSSNFRGNGVTVYALRVTGNAAEAGAPFVVEGKTIIEGDLEITGSVVSDGTISLPAETDPPVFLDSTPAGAMSVTAVRRSSYMATGKFVIYSYDFTVVNASAVDYTAFRFQAPGLLSAVAGSDYTGSAEAYDQVDGMPIAGCVAQIDGGTADGTVQVTGFFEKKIGVDRAVDVRGTLWYRHIA